MPYYKSKVGHDITINVKNKMIKIPYRDKIFLQEIDLDLLYPKFIEKIDTKNNEIEDVEKLVNEINYFIDKHDKNITEDII